MDGSSFILDCAIRGECKAEGEVRIFNEANRHLEAYRNNKSGRRSRITQTLSITVSYTISQRGDGIVGSSSRISIIVVVFVYDASSQAKHGSFEARHYPLSGVGLLEYLYDSKSPTRPAFSPFLCLLSSFMLFMHSTS
jgi:hypothetical protein